MSENEWHGTRTWQHEPSTFLKRKTTASLSSEYLKPYRVANVDDSTWFDLNRTTRHSKWRSVEPDVHLQIDIRYGGSSFVVTSRSIWQYLQPPIADTYEFFLSLLQIDFRYAYPPRIDFRFDDSSTAFDDSQRFGCIGQPSNVFIHE